jgi:transposase InsO family protein
MPWKETHKMNQRTEFVMKSMKTSNFRELCREYGISTKTGYKWKERFLEYGLEGMQEESRRPHGHATELGEDVICKIVQLKIAHPHWGPRKIRDLYERKMSGEVPSESSFKRVLERAGLTEPRKKRRRRDASERLATGRKAEKPNEVWTVDFKGWWKDREGLRVEPLTVRDEFSRMVLEVRLLENSRTESVKACFERLFERHGLPEAIRSDNGPPFASVQGLLGLSRLSAWWMALGIDLERSRPGCPQDNGAHERMHRDIRRELQSVKVGRDQDAFDVWRNEYNYERPHESLGMKRPCEIYQNSDRKWSGTPDDIDYEAMTTRRVTNEGRIRFEGEGIMLSTTLAGWSVGLNPVPEGLIEVWFAELMIGHIDPETWSFLAVRQQSKDAGQTEMKV